MILLLHNRYRLPGGEERAVEDLAWLIREHLGEDAEVLERDSAALGNRRAARRAAARRPRAGGGRARGAAHRRAGGARPQRQPVVRLARAGGGARGRARASCCTCTTTGSCARRGCASRAARTARAATAATRGPGVRLNCRGGSRAEAAAYAAGLALWQRRLAAQVDAFVVPSAFALGRLRELGAPVGDRAHVVGSVQREIADALARRARAATCSPRAGSRRRRASRTRSTRRAPPACRS